jgi:FKBP-type peptidyl-prolyl cis-trans isomerase
MPGKSYRLPAMKFPAQVLLGCMILGLGLTPALRAQREKLPPEDRDFVEKNWPEAKKTQTGIRYIVMREGQGDTPQPGDRVSVLYVGRLLQGTIFDENQDREHPFVFRVRREMVIEGWDQVLQLMKKGEKRLVIIPPELAYGTRGQPPKIPRNSTLVFEIELLDFKKE